MLEGLTSAMHYSMMVGVMQGLGNRRNEFRRFTVRQRVAADPDRQVGPFNELRDNVAQTILGWPCIMHGDDVGMVQAGQDSGFGDIEFQRARGCSPGGGAAP